MKYTKQDMTKMVEDLEAELKKSLDLAKSESGQQTLAKSEDEAKEEKKEEAKESKEDSKEEPKAEEAKESKEESKDAEGEAYDAQDMEELQKMYDSMSTAEHKAHIQSLKKAMQKSWKDEDMEKCWKGESMAKEEPKMEKADMDKCGEMKVEKSEPVASEVKTESKPEVSLAKSETEQKLEQLSKENENLKKSVDGLVSAMNTFFTKKAPARKAITNIEIVKKNEGAIEEKTLSKAEVNQILAKRTADPKLSVADRQAINEFYLNNAGLERIKHLLA